MVKPSEGQSKMSCKTIANGRHDQDFVSRCAGRSPRLLHRRAGTEIFAEVANCSLKHAMWSFSET
jgi:hypothetical protein